MGGLRIDVEDGREHAATPRTVNLNLVFQVTAVHAARQNSALELHLHPAAVTRVLRGDQPARDEQLHVFARETHLDRVTGYRQDMFDWAPAEFAGHLIRHGFGKYHGIEHVLDWLRGIKQTGGIFVDESALKMIVGSYRGLGRPGEVHADVPDASGQLGRRYGLLIPVPYGPVLDSIKRQKVTALLVHRERESGAIGVIATKPAPGQGHIGIVSYLSGPAAEIDDDWRSEPESASLARFQNCLLAEVQPDESGLLRPGYLIQGSAGRRDIHLFLFAEGALPEALAAIAGKNFDAEQGRLLRDAAVRGQAAGNVVAAHLVYDAC